MNQRPNILLIMSDEHDPQSPAVTGIPISKRHTWTASHPKAPPLTMLYRLPVCVPARMSFMTGQYVHQIGTWDNGSPLAGTIPTMGSYLEAAGYETAACGRTHFIGPELPARLWQTPHGRRRKMETLEYGCPLAHTRNRRGSNSHVTECGPGENWQIDYDSTATDLSERFLKSRALYADSPFFLYWLHEPPLSLLCPQEYFDRYYPDRVTLPHS